MTIEELVKQYNFHDSLIESIIYNNETKDLIIVFDYCFWAQNDTEEKKQDNGPLKIVFHDVKDYNGITGAQKTDYWTVLDGNIQNGNFHLLIEDIENGLETPAIHDIYIESSGVDIEDLR